MLGYERKGNLKFEGKSGEKKLVGCICRNLIWSRAIEAKTENPGAEAELQLPPSLPSPSTSVLQPSSDLNSPHHSPRQRFKNRSDL